MPTVKAAKPTEDPISGFFDALAGRGHEPTFGEDSATLRFDVGDGTRIERWYLTVTGGDVSVTRQNIRADTIVRVQRSDFEAMVTGRLNVMAALLPRCDCLRGQHGPPHDVPAILTLSSGLQGSRTTHQWPCRDGPKDGDMSGELVQILEGNTFVVSDDRGDIEASSTDPTGLFSFDTRFLALGTDRRRPTPECPLHR